jgi:hypothetical protein
MVLPTELESAIFNGSGDRFLTLTVDNHYSNSDVDLGDRFR